MFSMVPADKLHGCKTMNEKKNKVIAELNSTLVNNAKISVIRRRNVRKMMF